MSEVRGKVFIVAVEPDAKCELCGKLDKLRPYGPNGERICVDCGMKNQKATKAQFVKLIANVETVLVDVGDKSRN